MELPTEGDGTLLLSTLAAQFPGACGLKYRSETSSLRGVRLADGKLHPPETENVWGSATYICVFCKEGEESKRKYDEDMDGGLAKTQRLEKRNHTCSDLIVLGLSWSTNDEQLKHYFETFGEVVMCQVKKDITGNSKGFGFVRFANIDSQVRVLTQRHEIAGRWCEVKIPHSKQSAPQVPSKIFVGRMTEDITVDDLRDHFSKFGTVTDVFIPKPFRSFGFVTFSDNHVAQALCGEDHTVRNTSVHISSASPRSDGRHSNTSNRGQQLNLGNISPLAVAAALSQHWGLMGQQQQSSAPAGTAQPAPAAPAHQMAPTPAGNATAYWTAAQQNAAARITHSSATANSGWH